MASYSKPIDLINPEMLLQWTSDDLSRNVKKLSKFLTVLIPVERWSWCQRIFLFEKWTQELSRLYWKVQISCQIVEFCLCQEYQRVVLFWFVCVIPSYNSPVTIFGTRAIFQCYDLAQEFSSNYSFIKTRIFKNK